MNSTEGIICTIVLGSQPFGLPELRWTFGITVLTRLAASSSRSEYLAGTVVRCEATVACVSNAGESASDARRSRRGVTARDSLSAKMPCGCSYDIHRAHKRSAEHGIEPVQALKAAALHSSSSPIKIQLQLVKHQALSIPQHVKIHRRRCESTKSFYVPVAHATCATCAHNSHVRLASVGNLHQWPFSRFQMMTAPSQSHEASSISS